MPRFAILLHDTPQESHFDFMLEVNGVLKTWSLPCHPANGMTIEAKPLPDHRIAYLDYEGPVSGDRGTVARWDAGTYATQAQTDAGWVVELAGKKIRGNVTIKRETTGRTVILF
jgi:hypothetical protein